MHQLLQWLGGIFYLLNKVFFSFSERERNRFFETKARRWRIASWAAYLIGLPPWIIIFINKHRWIAASVEASGAPAMILGLVIAIRGTNEDPPDWLKRLAFICVTLGLACSFYDFGGLNTLNQWLEIGLASGFLIGTYLLAEERAVGYLWFVLMHISCGWLMWRENYHWLFWQQVVSLVFIIDAYLMQKRRKRGKCL